MTETPCHPDAARVAQYVDLLLAGKAPLLDEFCADLPSERRANVKALCADAAAAFAMLEAVRDAPQAVPTGALSGQRVGEFELLEELGRGGMGVVYRARQPSLERDVAIKILPAAGHDLRSIERFRTEALAAARVDDPSIVSVYAVGEQDGRLWIAMERVLGRSLYAELQAQRDGEPCRVPRAADRDGCRRIARLFARIARGLAAAHAAGVLHRDVQPKNILIEDSGTPRIIDFGLARIVDRPAQTRTGEVIGTPYYMSPEQVRALHRQIDHRTDVFSLGSVLYEALTLERPFDGSTSQQVMAAITRVEPVPIARRNTAVPADLAALCECALEKEPQRRFQSMAEFADELERVADDEPTRLRPPGPVGRALRVVRRHRAVAATVVLLGLASVAGAALAQPRTPTATLEFGEALAGAEVWTAPIEPTLWVLGEFARAGTAPIGVRLPLGYHRVALRNATGFVELTWHVATADTTYEIGEHVRILPADVVRAGMVRVPAGEFTSGSSTQAADYPGAAVQRSHLPEYWIDATEVSNADYRAYVLATGVREPPVWPDDWREAWDEHWDHLPVASVTLAEARAYAAWAGKRLPTEREWEKAVRGVDGWLLPWRADFDAADAQSRANVGAGRTEGSREWTKRWAVYLEHVEPVDGRPDARSPFGLHHALGNVAEWTDTPLSQYVDGVATLRAGFQRVRGAYYEARETHWPAAILLGIPDHANAEFLGFRCAASGAFPHRP